MNETITVPFNDKEGKEKPKNQDKQGKIIFYNKSKDNVTITAVDPALGIAVEVTIQKRDVPRFASNPSAK